MKKANWTYPRSREIEQEQYVESTHRGKLEIFSKWTKKYQLSLLLMSLLGGSCKVCYFAFSMLFRFQRGKHRQENDNIPYIQSKLNSDFFWSIPGNPETSFFSILYLEIQPHFHLMIINNFERKLKIFISIWNVIERWPEIFFDVLFK